MRVCVLVLVRQATEVMLQILHDILDIHYCCGCVDDYLSSAKLPLLISLICDLFSYILLADSTDFSIRVWDVILRKLRHKVRMAWGDLFHVVDPAIFFLHYVILPPQLSLLSASYVILVSCCQSMCYVDIN